MRETVNRYLPHQVYISYNLFYPRKVVYIVILIVEYKSDNSRTHL